jgi:hypothetical protein
MSVRNKPNYGIYVIPLSAAGSQDLPVLGTRLVVVNLLLNATFTNVAGASIVSGGTPSPNSFLNAQIGKALGDPVPLGINGKIECEELFDFVRLSWAAQAGVTAIVLIDDDHAGAGVLVDAPSAILGGAVSIIGGGVAVENVGTAGMGGQLNVSDEVPVGLELVNNSTLAANSALQLVAAGANAGGTRVRTFELASAAGGATALVTGISSPATLGSGINLLVSLNAVPAILPKPLFIRPSWGLWLFNTTVNGQAWGTWDP